MSRNDNYINKINMDTIKKKHQLKLKKQYMILNEGSPALELKQKLTTNRHHHTR